MLAIVVAAPARRRAASIDLLVELACKVKRYIGRASIVSATVVEKFVGASTVIYIAAIKRQTWYFGAKETFTCYRPGRFATAFAVCVYLNAAEPAFVTHAITHRCFRLDFLFPVRLAHSCTRHALLDVRRR